MAEGRVRNEGGGFGLVLKMEYFITDQQGNTRVSFEDDGTGTAIVKQENSYYAFGMQMAGGYTPTTNANKKLYNAGSEWQDDVEGLADYYSTFFREYDPIIGRFNGVDPMAEATDEITTYAYANNNPVMMNDPLGNYAVSEGYGSEYRVLKSWEVADRIMMANGWGDWAGGNDYGGGGGGDIRFSNAKELFEYVQKMGTNSVNTSFGGMYADAFGVYDMSLSEVSSAWRSLGELGVTPGYGGKNNRAGDINSAQELTSFASKLLTEFNRIGGNQESGEVIIDKFQRILFRDPDLAAEFWGTIVLSRNGAYEYSALMYEFKIDGEKFYGLTTAVRFDKYGEPTPLQFSPPPTSSKHAKMWMAGGSLYAHLHNHTLSDQANLTFSYQDQKMIANNRLRHYYLITVTGLVMYMNQNGIIPIQKRHFPVQRN